MNVLYNNKGVPLWVAVNKVIVTVADSKYCIGLYLGIVFGSIRQH